jgi:hypothetical protein
MTRAERLADFDTRKLLCDRCLYKVEQNEETPIAEFCKRCQTKLVDWAMDMIDWAENGDLLTSL